MLVLRLGAHRAGIRTGRDLSAWPLVGRPPRGAVLPDPHHRRMQNRAPFATRHYDWPSQEAIPRQVTPQSQCLVYFRIIDRAML